MNFARSASVLASRAAGLVLILVLSLPAAGAAAERRPNIVFVLTDDQRWDCLGSAGNPHLKTPAIDRIAGEGVRFANAFCTTSLCSPSRASILSGLYAHSHGVTDNFTEYPTRLESFPKRLQEEGYATAYLGKWHMGEDNDERRPGFDFFATHKGQGKYFDTEFNVDGKREVLKGYYTTRVTDLALEWLEKQSGDKPFLLMLGHKAPHSFYVPEPKYEHVFDAVRFPYPASAFHLEDKPEWITTRLKTWHGIYGPLFDYRKKFPDTSAEAVVHFEQMTRSYLGTILSVDDSVGRLDAWLRAKNLSDNTIFVYMADNGLLNGEHGMVDKRTMHEPSIRIPMIVRAPGRLPRGKVETAQVLTIDVAPSLLELCGAKPLEKIHGRSWVKLVTEGDPAWRKAWYYEYNYEKQFPYTPNVRGIRTDRWKYIRYPHGDGTPDRHKAELYDLSADPGEDKNLIDDPQLAKVRNELAQDLARLIRKAGADPDTIPVDGGIKAELPDLKIR